VQVEQDSANLDPCTVLRSLVCSRSKAKSVKFIRKSPFKSQIEATEQMVKVLSLEAESQGNPLSEADKTWLASETEGRAQLSEDFRLRIHKLIQSLIERETTLQTEDTPTGFLATFEWASDAYSPHIVVLTYEVIDSGALGQLPKLHGRKWLKDKAQLIGCGFLVVVLMMLIVGLVAFFSQRK
jgi:hypothetical protein